MEEVIKKRLSAIHSEEDRRYFQNLMIHVFSELEHQVKQDYQQLEKRVEDEIVMEQSSYAIRTAIIDKSAYDRKFFVMQPMLEEDLQEDQQEDLRIVQTGEKKKLKRVFLKADSLQIESMKLSERKFQGEIYTNEGTYKATFFLEPAKEYEEEIEKLYQDFIQNGLEWNTVNAPYIKKMYHIVLLESEEMKETEEIIDYKVAFMELESLIHYNMIPIWNVKKHQMQTVGFPSPCEDYVNFIHTISIKKYGTSDGYIVRDRDHVLSYVRRGKENLYLTGTVKEARKWLVYQICSKEEDIFHTLEYPIMENKIAKDFITKLAMKGNKTIHTKAELKRFVDSFGYQKQLIFSSVCIVSDGKECETYSMNPFIQDEIRVPSANSYLLLTFQAMDRKSFLIRDILSFIISQVQIQYPEYQCIGRLEK